MFLDCDTCVKLASVRPIHFKFVNIVYGAVFFFYFPPSYSTFFKHKRYTRHVLFPKLLSSIRFKEKRMSSNWQWEVAGFHKEIGCHYVIFLGNVMLGIMQQKQQQHLTVSSPAEGVRRRRFIHLSLFPLILLFFFLSFFFPYLILMFYFTLVLLLLVASASSRNATSSLRLSAATSSRCGFLSATPRYLSYLLSAWRAP